MTAVADSRGLRENEHRQTFTTINRQRCWRTSGSEATEPGCYELPCDWSDTLRESHGLPNWSGGYPVGSRITGVWWQWAQSRAGAFWDTFRLAGPRDADIRDCPSPVASSPEVGVRPEGPAPLAGHADGEPGLALCVVGTTPASGRVEDTVGRPGGRGGVRVTCVRAVPGSSRPW